METRAAENLIIYAGPAEWVEDQLAFRRGGHDGAANETKGFLYRVTVMGFLPHGYGGDVPYGGDLGGGVGAVYEVVVEGVARSLALASPQECFVVLGPRKLGQRQV